MSLTSGGHCTGSQGGGIHCGAASATQHRHEVSLGSSQSLGRRPQTPRAGTSTEERVAAGDTVPQLFVPVSRFSSFCP